MRRNKAYSENYDKTQRGNDEANANFNLYVVIEK